MAVSSALLAPYVSPLVLRRLAQEPRPLAAAEQVSFEAAALIIDVCGFASLAESLTRQGPTGVERLTDAINACFGGLVDTMCAHGGEIVHFFGDSALVLWPASGQPGGRVQATHRAAYVAWSLTRDCGAGGQPGGLARALPLRAAVAAGQVTTAHVGGLRDRWELYVGGEALLRVGRVFTRARAGETVVCAQAWRDIRHLGSGEPVGEDATRVLMLTEPEDCRQAAEIRVPEAALPALSGHVPRALLSHLDAGQERWMAELRTVSVIFIRVAGVDESQRLSVGLIQATVSEAQAILYRYEGSLDKLSLDEKGLTLLAAMGLPPLRHEDDAVRAVMAGVGLHSYLAGAGFDCSVGIATGRVFCGAVGGVSRREYTIMGSAVNLAARLMMAAGGGVLCDQATADAAQQRCEVDFKDVPALEIRGLPGRIPVFPPADSWRAPDGSPASSRARKRPSSWVAPRMLGRREEQERLGEFLRRLSAGVGGWALVMGEAGIGKSLFVADAIREAGQLGICPLLGSCEAMHRTAPYYPWRPILTKLLELDPSWSLDEQRSAALRTVSHLPNGVALAPLLNSVVPLGFEESEFTSQLTGDVRRNNIHALAMQLFRRVLSSGGAGHSSMLVVVEDAHWMDSASWALLSSLQALTRELPLAILVSMRPGEEASCPDSVRCLAAPPSLRTQLEGLALPAVDELVRRRLGAAKVAEEVTELVQRLTHGNPFFCQQLVLTMWEAQQLTVHNGVCRLSGGGPAEHPAVLPDSVQAVVVGRLDRLPAPELITLKTASVIGDCFSFELLKGVHPLQAGDTTLREHLSELVCRDLLQRVTGGQEEAYRFQHAITREVAYEAMLPAQRRSVHRAVAAWYESTEGGALAGRATLLFHHLRHCGDVVCALRYAYQAGTVALRQGSYREAIDCFEYGLQAVTDHAEEALASGAPSLATWAAQLGEAQVALGMHEAGRAHLESALRRLGWPVPASPVRIGATVAAELLRQSLHRALPRRLVTAAKSRHSELLRAAAAYEQLGYVYYSAGETLHGVHAAIRMLNLAERGGASPILARAHAAISLAASLISQHAVASVYERHAHAVARDLGDPLTVAHVRWVSALRAAGLGNWAVLDQGGEQAAEESERLRDFRLFVMSTETLASGAYLRGELERADALSHRQLEIARNQHNLLWEAWASNGLAEVALARGAVESTISHSENALRILAVESDRIEEIRALGLLAMALHRHNRCELALEAARKAAQLIGQTEPTGFNALEGYAGSADVLLWTAARTEGPGGSSERRAAQQAGTRAFAQLARYAAVFPIGRPRALLLRARVERRRGRHARAAKLLARAAAAARDMGMRCELARVLEEKAAE